MDRNTFRRGTAGAVLAVAAVGGGGTLLAMGSASAASPTVVGAASTVSDQVRTFRYDEQVLVGTASVRTVQLLVSKPLATAAALYA
jgi:hypothetical protein